MPVPDHPKQNDAREKKSNASARHGRVTCKNRRGKRCSRRLRPDQPGRNIDAAGRRKSGSRFFAFVITLSLNELAGFVVKVDRDFFRRLGRADREPILIAGIEIDRDQRVFFRFDCARPMSVAHFETSFENAPARSSAALRAATSVSLSGVATAVVIASPIAAKIDIEVFISILSPGFGS